MRVRRVVTKPIGKVVFNALRKDSYLNAIVNAAFLVDSRLDHAANLICDELKRRGHHRTPCGLSSYSFSTVRAAIVGWGTST